MIKWMVKAYSTLLMGVIFLGIFLMEEFMVVQFCDFLTITSTSVIGRMESKMESV